MRIFLKRLKSYYWAAFERDIWTACKQAAETDDDNDRAAAFTGACRSSFKCENCRVSRHSPGPVLDDEILLFIVTEPQIIISAGKVHPQSLGLVYSKGVSTLRNRAEDNEILDTWNELISSKKQRRFSGVFNFSARQVRRSHNPRLFGVFDTGELRRPNHADILAMVSSGTSRREKERLKKAASDALSDAVGTNYVSAADFRGGKFQHLSYP